MRATGSYLLMMLPGRATLTVYPRPSFGVYTAVGFDVSTAVWLALSSRFLFWEMLVSESIVWILKYVNLPWLLVVP